MPGHIHVGTAPGYFCVGGQRFACSTGSFNPNASAADATACRSCAARFGAEHLVTLTVGASSEAQCVCSDGYFDAAARAASRSCVPCEDEGG